MSQAATPHRVNRALREAGIDAVLRRCAAGPYYYFTGPAVERCHSTSVYTAHCDSFSIAQWVDMARQFKEAQTTADTPASAFVMKLPGARSDAD